MESNNEGIWCQWWKKVSDLLNMQSRVNQQFLSQFYIWSKIWNSQNFTYVENRSGCCFEMQILKIFSDLRVFQFLLDLTEDLLPYSNDNNPSISNWMEICYSPGMVGLRQSSGLSSLFFVFSSLYRPCTEIFAFIYDTANPTISQWKLWKMDDTFELG